MSTCKVFCFYSFYIKKQKVEFKNIIFDNVNKPWLEEIALFELILTSTTQNLVTATSRPLWS